MKKKSKDNISKVKKVYILEKYNLNETDKKVLQYKLKFENITQEEISVLVDISPVMVCKILNKPEVKNALKEFDGNWISMLINAKEKASKKMITLMNNPNPSIAIRACENILQLDKVDLTQTEDEQAPF